MSAGKKARKEPSPASIGITGKRVSIAVHAVATPSLTPAQNSMPDVAGPVFIGQLAALTSKNMWMTAWE